MVRSENVTDQETDSKPRPSRYAVGGPISTCGDGVCVSLSFHEMTFWSAVSSSFHPHLSAVFSFLSSLLF